jgi:hypothetical protein
MDLFHSISNLLSPNLDLIPISIGRVRYQLTRYEQRNVGLCAIDVFARYVKLRKTIESSSPPSNHLANPVFPFTSGLPLVGSLTCT